MLLTGHTTGLQAFAVGACTPARTESHRLKSHLGTALQAYHEFCKYSLMGTHVDSYSRGAAAKAYDHLLSQGLMAFVDPRCVRAKAE